MRIILLSLLFSLLLPLESLTAAEVRLYGKDSFLNTNQEEAHLVISQLSHSLFRIQSCGKKIYQKRYKESNCTTIRSEISYQQLISLHDSLAPEEVYFIATSQNGGLYFKQSKNKDSGWLDKIKLGKKSNTTISNGYTGASGLILALIEVHFLGQKNKITFDPEDTKPVVSFSDSTFYVEAPIRPLITQLKSQFKIYFK